MTAINVFVRPDRAYLMTDGAVYLPDMTIVGFGSKAMPIPNLHAAIAVRGLQGVATAFAFDFSIRYRNADEMFDRLPDDLREWHELRLMELSAGGWQDVDLYVIGWSARRKRMHAVQFSTRDDHPQAGEAIEGGDGYSIAHTLPDEIEQVELKSQGVDFWNKNFLRNFDPVGHGIPIMEAQRRELHSGSDLSLDISEPVSIVGGHITLTTINNMTISQRIIHRWADVPGEPIRPEPFKETAKSRALKEEWDKRQYFINHIYKAPAA